MLSDYFQVKVDDVYKMPGFVHVHQAPANIRPEPYIVGWNGSVAYYDMPAEEIAMHMNEWLIQENERLKDEVEELQIDNERCRNDLQWWMDNAIGDR
ncbi:MAG: hypothetical protein JRE23_03210 [Deltaproteobacteria bacterium]|nr:hypothetical protein [Deltaproteobacteria bacterium]